MQYFRIGQFVAVHWLTDILPAKVRFLLLLVVVLLIYDVQQFVCLVTSFNILVYKILYHDKGGSEKCLFFTFVIDL